MSFNLNYKPFGSNAILIEWPEEISPVVLEDIIGFKQKIETNKENPVQEIINCYNSLTIVYSSQIENNSKTIEALKTIYSESFNRKVIKPKVWQIPVCYDEEFGFDLLDISEEKRLPIKELIKLHTKPFYTVYFIGFLPGFLYLGGLNEKLKINRKANPRLKVPEGSVGIGGNQTGIYPIESAGGWNIIGRTPISFFDISKKNPCFANPGDQIQFISISKNEFEDFENRIKNDLHQLNPLEND